MRGAPGAEAMRAKEGGLRQASLTEELPVWELRDGVVWLSDGRLEVPVLVTPPPTAMRSTAQLEAMLHPLRSLLRSVLPEGERLRLVVEAAPMGEGRLVAYRELTQAANEAVAYLAEDRAHLLEQSRRRGELLEWRAHVSLTWSGMRRRRRYEAFSPEEHTQALERARRLRQQMASMLEAAGYGPEVPDDQAAFEMLWRYLNPGLAAVPPRYVPLEEYYPESALKALPSLSPLTLRSQLAASAVQAQALDHLAVGDRRVRVLVAAGLPDATAFGLTDRLLAVGGPLVLVVDVVHLSFERAIKRLKGRARRYASTASDTTMAYVDPNVKVGLRETDEALQHISLTGDHVFEVGLAVVLVGRELEDLEDRTARLQSSLSQALPGCRLYPVTFGQFGAWLDLLPCGGGLNARRGVMLETNAAHYFPAGGPWSGSASPVCLWDNRYGSLTALDPFDRATSNWNAIVIGGSGSGKTFFMQCLLAELMRQGADVIIVDRGFGYAPWVEMVGGAVVNVAPGGETAINPFDLEEGQLEPDEDKVAFLVALVQAMVSEQPSKLEEAILQAAVRQTYSRGLTEREVDGRLVRQREPVFLSDLVRVLATLDEVNNRPASPEDRAVAGELATRLQAWVGDSVYGRFVDRPTSFLPEAPVVYFETSALEQQKELEPVALLLLADRVWKRVRKDPGRRKVVVFDEAWALLRRPTAAAFVVELYRRFRRYNAAVYSVTQSLGDFRTEATRGILQNTSYYFLLRLPGEEELVAQVLDLSDRAMALFRSLRGHKGRYNELLCWIRTEQGLVGDVVRLRPSPLAYWAFTTDPRDMARRQAAEVRWGGDRLRAVYELAYGAGSMP